MLKTAQYVPTLTEKMITTQSAIFYPQVLAHDFKWKAAGSVNAMGVQAIAPSSERNLSILSPSDRVKTTVTMTKVDLEMFFMIILFFDFGQPL